MDPILAGILGIILLVILVVLGMPIAFALFSVGSLGLLIWMGPAAMYSQISTVAFGWTYNFGLAVMPLFILMGSLMDIAGFVNELFTAVKAWAGRLPGGLAIATMIANAFFGAVSASSLAAAALFTRVALPEMLKNGYSKRLSVGSITAGACLAQMIPPSMTLVMMGIIAGESIGQLLMGGFIPGILTAVVYIIVILILCTVNPKLGPPENIRYTFKEKVVATKGVYSILLIAILIIAGIYLGWFTPTEAGAIGAFAALLIVIFRRKLTRENSWKALVETGSTIAMVFILIIGGVLFSRFLVISNFTSTLVEMVTSSGLPPLGFVALSMLMFLFLGTILDPGSMMIVTIPLLWPIIEALGLNPIWYGILINKMIEIAMITPPVALVLYTVKGAAGNLVSLNDVIMGILPFIATNIVVLALLIFIPEITLYLPMTMKGT